MRTANRTICLLIDNFSGHNVAYDPTNIQLEWFEPNLTSHVQPLDAGIIRCFKAHYRRAFCIRALDHDDAGESDIYKIDLLEAMLMAREAWNEVSATTIKNCWDHTGIQRPPIKAITLRIPTNSGAPSGPSLQPSPDGNSAAAWDIIEQFATTDMALPDAENALRKHLGGEYADDNWQPALKAVMDAEGDAALALAAVTKLRLASSSMASEWQLKPPSADTTQCQLLEEDLLKSVAELRRRNRIHGEVLTLEEMLDPVEELEIGKSEYAFEGDADIVTQVLHEQAVERGEIVEVASDSEDDEGSGPGLSNDVMMDLCRQLEVCCLDTDAGCSLELSRNLRRFRAHLRQSELKNAKQVTLDSLWL
jgi:DDE superfamily endonuclease